MKKKEKKNSKVSPYSRFFAEELNFSRLPFFASSTKGLKNKKKIEFRRIIEIGGQTVESLWKVTANAEYGYPGSFAESVHAAILQIVTEQGLPVQNPVKFSFYDICKRLGIEYSGRTTQKIRNAIRSTRLAGIEIRHSFHMKDGSRPRFEDIQNLYTRVIFFGDEDSETGEAVELSAVWLADFYRESLNSGHIRPIDFEYFKQIREKSWAVTKIYQFLGYRFAVGCFGKHRNPYAKVDYEELCIIADVKQQRYLSLAKQKLETAHNVLVETGYVDRIEWVEEKQGKGKPKKLNIRYYPGRRAREEYRMAHLKVTKQLSLQLEPVQEGKTSPVLIDDLTALGVKPQKASELVAGYTADQIEFQLDHLEFLVEIGKAPRDNGAWLSAAIPKGYDPPAGFKDRKAREAERKAREQAQAERRKEEERKRHEEQAIEARYTELDEWLVSLPKKDQQSLQKKIEDQIKSGFDHFMNQLYRTKEFEPKAPMHRHEYYRILGALRGEYEKHV